MDENRITNRDRILWFFIGVVISLCFHFFSKNQEPVIQPEPKVIEHSSPEPERKQDHPILEPKVFSERFPEAFPPGFYSFINGKVFETSGKVYQDNDGIVYQVMHDNYKFYRGFFFIPTTDDIPKWYPVETLPWQATANAAQADLDKMAEREHWKLLESGIILEMRNIHSEEGKFGISGQE